MLEPSPPPRRIAERIADQLRRRILLGHYAPGDKLPAERHLARTLGVNRASLREALKALEQLGLVRSRQGDGTRVLDFMKTAGIELMAHLVSLSAGAGPAEDTAAGAGELLADLLEFRRIYGREVARLAADRWQEDDLRRLEALAAASAQETTAPKTPAEALRLDFDFYVALTRATRNRVLQLLVNTVRAAVEHYTDRFEGLVRPDEVRRHHQTMLAALRSRDGAAAARAADRHLATGEAGAPGGRLTQAAARTMKRDA